MVKVRQILTSRRWAVAALQGWSTVKAVSRRAQSPCHEFRCACRLQLLRPLAVPQVELNAELVEVALQDLVQRSNRFVGLGHVLNNKRSAVGLLAPAVAVAINVTVHLEQCPRARQVVAADLGYQRRVVAVRVRIERRLCLNRLSSAWNAYFFLNVGGERQCPPERYPLWRVSAHNRILHIEHGIR